MTYVAAAAVALGDLILLAACWKTRSALGGVLGAIGIGLAGLSIAEGPSRGGGEYALFGAVGVLVIGAALFGLGQWLGRLLEETPADGS